MIYKKLELEPRKKKLSKIGTKWDQEVYQQNNDSWIED